MPCNTPLLGFCGPFAKKKGGENRTFVAKKGLKVLFESGVGRLGLQKVELFGKNSEKSSIYGSFSKVMFVNLSVIRLKNRTFGGVEA